MKRTFADRSAWLGLSTIAISSAIASSCGVDPNSVSSVNGVATSPAAIPPANPGNHLLVAGPNGKQLSARISNPFDISAISQRSKHSFHSSNGTFGGIGGGLQIQVSADGEILVKASQLDLQLALTTSAIRRGHSLLKPSQSHLDVAPDGAVEMSRGDWVEKVRNSDNGTEQSWSFPRRPAGSGDLLVQVLVKDAPALVTEDQHGVSFRRSQDAPALRYGHGTWIDALGRKTAIASRWQNGKVVLTVPAFVVDQASYPALLDPAVGLEFGMGSDLPGDAVGATLTALATNNAGYFITWQAANKAEYGTLLDPQGASIAKVPLGAGVIDLVCNGSDYAVVRKDGSTTKVRLVASDGSTKVQDNDVTSDADSEIHAASDGAGNLLFVWPKGTSIWALRLNSSLIKLDASPIEVASGQIDPANLKAIWGGTHYVVAWNDSPFGNDDIFGATIGSDGTVLAQSLLLKDPAAQNYPALVFEKSQTLLTWNDSRSNGRLYGQLILDQDLTTSQPVDLGPLKDPGHPAQLLFDGSRFLWIWKEPNGVFASRVSLDAPTLDPAPLKISAASITGFPRAAAMGTSQLLAWATADLGFGASTLMGARMSSEPDLLFQAPISFATSSQTAQLVPQIGASSSGYFVIWKDSRLSQKGTLWGTRISPNGTVLDQNGIKFDAENPSGCYHVAGDHNGDFLVIYKNNSSLYTARIDASGYVFPPQLLSNHADLAECSIVFGESHYLAMWQETTDIVASRLNLNGQPVDLPPLIAFNAVEKSTYTFPSSYGNGFFFAAHYMVDGYAIRLIDKNSGAMSVIDPYQLPTVSPNYYGMTFDGSRFNMAISDRVYAFSPDATLLTPGGTNVLVSTPYLMSFDGIGSLLFGKNGNCQWLMPDGQLTNLSSLLQVKSTSSALASIGGGNSLFAYTNASKTDGVGNPRLWGRLISFGSDAPVGSSCSLGIECASSFCSDGVCCNESCGAGTPLDCQSCSVLTGASADGVCSTRPAGQVCRPSSGLCDVQELCDGSSLSCPADTLIAKGIECRKELGACDLPDSCDGLTKNCRDSVLACGTVCRATVNSCDRSEYCNGSSPTCADNAFAPQFVPCNDQNTGTSCDYCDGNGTCLGTNPSLCAADAGTWDGGSLPACSPADSGADSSVDTGGNADAAQSVQDTVSVYECPEMTEATGSSSTAFRELFRVCALINSNGTLTIRAQKNKTDAGPSNFGNRVYDLRESLPSDPECGPTSWFYQSIAASPAGIGTAELEFTAKIDWPSVSTERAYCVTARTQSTDVSFDPLADGQKAWWWSKKVIVRHVVVPIVVIDSATVDSSPDAEEPDADASDTEEPDALVADSSNDSDAEDEVLDGASESADSALDTESPDGILDSPGETVDSFTKIDDAKADSDTLADSDSRDDPQEQKSYYGCNCSTPGMTPFGSTWFISLLFVIGLRRRRSKQDHQEQLAHHLRPLSLHPNLPKPFHHEQSS